MAKSTTRSTVLPRSHWASVRSAASSEQVPVTKAQRRWAPIAVAAIPLAALAMTAGAAHAAQTTVIYADPLSGSASTSLNGAGTDVASGLDGGATDASWIAAPTWTDDGALNSTATAGDNAFLPFVPQSGLVYTLSATINAIATQGAGWLGIGFTTTNSTTGLFQQLGAYDWLLLRGSRGAGQGQSFLGPDEGGLGTYDTPSGAEDVTIVLDTGNPTDWIARIAVNNVTIASGDIGDPAIAYVGFGGFTASSATVQNFVLSDTPVPEPATAAILAAGLLGIGVSQRSKRRSPT